MYCNRFCFQNDCHNEIVERNLCIQCEATMISANKYLLSFTLRALKQSQLHTYTHFPTRLANEASQEVNSSHSKRLGVKVVAD